MKRQSQQGIALVITLILLSVITFMTVTFLVISGRERDQVDTTTQQTVAKFAADGMEQQAAAQIVALMLGQTNGYNFGLLVSTNFVSQGYNPANPGSLYNVNYYYDALHGGGTLSSVDELAMLTNLLFLPRAPVFVITNKNAPPDFRFYNDLNGNGIYDTNGIVTNLDPTGQILTIGVNPVVTMQTGDPEWIGFLEHPDQRYSPSNFFLGRGSFIAVPIGNALDMNYIHNQAKLLGPGNDGYLRNQGVGSWEINLAAFLHTLNTNWDFNGTSYLYNNTNIGVPSPGTSFVDAASILEYRYNNSYSQLNNFNAMYLGSPGFLIGNYYIDGYSSGPIMTNVWPLTIPSYPTIFNPINNPWSGADNPVQFFGARDLLTMIPGVTLPTSFTNHLYSAGINLDTYDRYTFYRMLAQMGVGSAPEPTSYPIGGSNQFTVTTVATLPPIAIGGRNQMSRGTVPEAYPYPHGHEMNLNYNNISNLNNSTLSATNFMPWTPAQFFTNAADRMLRTYFPTNFAVVLNGNTVVTNLNINFIPIYPVNYYTPSVHRLLQLAANMFDASTNKSLVGPDFFDYPSVFRPIYNKTGSGANSLVYISGYYEVSNNANAYQSQPLDFRRVTLAGYELDLMNGNRDALNNDYIDNVYGIPYVIGAKKGFPAFDKFSFSPVVQMTRKLQAVKAQTNTPIQQWHINAQYYIGVSNFLAVELWNSYTNAYPRTVRLLATNDLNMYLTNNVGITTYNVPLIVNNVLSGGNPPVVVSNTWPGMLTLSNYIRPIIAGVQAITNSLVSPPVLIPIGSTPANLPVATTPNYYTPQWGLNITNRVRLIMQDMPNGPAGAPGRLIDYVELSGVDSYDNINNDLASLPVPNGMSPGGLFTSGWLWGTNTLTNNPIPAGMLNQIYIAAGLPTVPNTIWSNVPGGGSVTGAINNFNQFLHGYASAGLTAQVPFVASTVYTKTWTWSANDPLVHYLASDLTDPNLFKTNVPRNLDSTSQTNIFSILQDNNKISTRYTPWNRGNVKSPLNGQNENQLAFIDPRITGSDSWQFPTNKYPNVGWLGRVHRGTPWQTVYMKATGVKNATVWQNWTGDTQINNFGISDAATSQPVNDWQMLDLFTAAPNDNASRGQLSVNQTNSAAWAAVMDGVMVLANDMTPGVLVATNINTTQPGGPGQFIINGTNGINQQRANAGGVFTSTGQILSASNLTVTSPYINTNDLDTNLTDAVYERIPQQIMGLLRLGTPRYAIYSYGQALKPANNSIVQSGASFGLCTNYQITGEALTRTIVRFDNLPVPGQPLPGTTNVYALSAINKSGTFVVVTNILPPVRAVVESYSILGPDQ